MKINRKIQALMVVILASVSSLSFLAMTVIAQPYSRDRKPAVQVVLGPPPPPPEPERVPAPPPRPEESELERFAPPPPPPVARRQP